MKVNWSRSLFYVGAFSLCLLAALSGGCTTRATAEAQTRAAYLAGENAALEREQASQRTGIVVLGQVQTHEVPWVAGLTLAQALVTANYNGFGNPKRIILIRQGQHTVISARDLLNGQDMPLQPGDMIQIQ
jgi:hypothetical protein